MLYLKQDNIVSHSVQALTRFFGLFVPYGPWGVEFYYDAIKEDKKEIGAPYVRLIFPPEFDRFG